MNGEGQRYARGRQLHKRTNVGSWNLLIDLEICGNTITCQTHPSEAFGGGEIVFLLHLFGKDIPSISANLVMSKCLELFPLIVLNFTLYHCISFIDTFPLCQPAVFQL